MGTYSIFTPQPLMAGGEGFALFGPAHLLWLAVCVMVVVLLARRYAALPEGVGWRSPRRRMMLAVAAVPLALLASDDAVMIAGGAFPPAWWPLHVCNMCEFLCLAYALRPTGAFGRFAGEVLFTLGIVGATAALLFCNWAYCPPLTWASICCFLEHAFVLSFAIMLLFGGDLHPRTGDLWMAVAFAAGYAAIMRPLNAAIDTNFGFVNQPATGSPLELMAHVFGTPGYLVPYALLILAVCLVLHLCWSRRHPD